MTQILNTFRKVLRYIIFQQGSSSTSVLENFNRFFQTIFQKLQFYLLFLYKALYKQNFIRKKLGFVIPFVTC